MRGYAGQYRGEAERSMARTTMKYVYLPPSPSDPTKRYVGSTGNVKRRLAEHNAGKSPHTAKYVPWEIVVAVYFKEDTKAEASECYVKDGSGHAFAKRHFW